MFQLIVVKHIIGGYLAVKNAPIFKKVSFF